MLCLGAAAQPCSSSGTERIDSPGGIDAAASDWLCRDLQSTLPQTRGVVSESLQIDSVSGGSVLIGAGPLHPSEYPPGEVSREFRCSGSLPIQRAQCDHGVLEARMAGRGHGLRLFWTERESGKKKLPEVC